MNKDEIPDLITDEAKARIDTLAQDIETGVRSGTLDVKGISAKTTAIVVDIFQDWKHSLIPDDITVPDTYHIPSNGNSIDTHLGENTQQVRTTARTVPLTRVGATSG
jgi:hypothetical protein